MKWSRNPSYFMEPGSSLPHLQEPDTCPCPEPNQSGPGPPSHFLKIHFNIIFTSTLNCSKWSLLLRLLHQTPVHTSPTYVSIAPSICSCCVQQHIMKLLVMQTTPVYCYVIQLRPKYLPQNRILKNILQLMFHLQCFKDQVSHPCKTIGKVACLPLLTFKRLEVICFR